MKPIVAIVGRANVGKSTFFNKICGKRISIVDDVAGVTRDRIYADAEWCGRNFTLVDTGGVEFASEDVFQKEIREQVMLAIENANVIVFVVDGKTGITQADEDVAKLLRKQKVPVVLVVNKLDTFDVSTIYEFYGLGVGEPMPISCVQSKGIGDVLDAVVSHFPTDLKEEEDADGIKISLVGRPNVGKSSLINRLLGKKRVVVSDVEGTTRDSVVVPFRCNKKDYFLIDTAGLRRQRSVEKQSVEGYSVLRSMSAIEMSDVVLIVLDATKEISEQDVRIAGYVHEAGKANVIVVNKWDEKTMTKDEYNKLLQDKFSFMDYFQAIFVSALTGTGLSSIMEMVEKVYGNASRRITTGILNDIVHDAILNFEPPTKSGRRSKILFATQPSTNPPKFIFFCKDPELINFSYQRYLENKLREKVDFSGTPIELVFKGRDDND